VQTKQQVPVSQTSKKGQKGKGKRTVPEPEIIWDQYVSAEEDEPRGKGGRKRDPDIYRLALPCYHKDDISRKHKLARCLGMQFGCDVTMVWPRQKIRWQKHFADCKYIPSLEQQEANSKMAESAPSVQLAHLGSGNAPVSKKVRIDSTIRHPEATAGVPTMSDEEPGPTTKLKPSLQPSVLGLAKKAKRDQVTLQLDLDVLRWICVSGTPPYRVDLPEWKTMWLHANPNYTPASSSRLVDYHLPRECAHIRMVQIEELKKCTNLSLTFDGNTTRLPQSIYTIHVITADRHVYLFEGHGASDQSHTADHLWREVKAVSLSLGVSWFGY